MRTTHTIDAQAQKIGRVSTQAAKILMGKNSTAYVPNVVPDVEVRIINAAKADISEKKKEEKIYRRYTGYPGGLIDTTLKRMIEKKGAGEAFRIAVKGMLPKNKLQAQYLKNLVVTE
ncbi:MAG TPA: 50S ribosomal protein L13 [Candidatus Paceibacterota bacterium]|nr:50S ribosomal protein L13 [Candidatus Paceibacterota bacterium]